MSFFEQLAAYIGWHNIIVVCLRVHVVTTHLPLVLCGVHMQQMATSSCACMLAHHRLPPCRVLVWHVTYQTCDGWGEVYTRASVVPNARAALPPTSAGPYQRCAPTSAALLPALPPTSADLLPCARESCPAVTSPTG